MDYLWLSSEVTTAFWADTATLSLPDIPDDTVLGDLSRDQRENCLFDAWGHCFLGAASTRSLGEPLTWALGGAYEVMHETLAICLPLFVHHDSFIQDTFNQSVGRSIGLSHPTGHLGALSFEAMAGGRLDLTLAGVGRGARLRPGGCPNLRATEARLERRALALEREREAAGPELDRERRAMGGPRPL